MQYAHARICSVIEQYQAQGGDASALPVADLSRLQASSETALLRKLAEYPQVLAAAAAALAPHEVAVYAREVAADFHSYYAAERFLVDGRGAGGGPAGVARRHAPGHSQCVDRAWRGRTGTHGEGSGSGMRTRSSARTQRGGFFIGLVIGLLIGLGLALGVALYVTKVPNPFVNKVPQRSPGQDAAEAERNRNWDPNSALAGRNPAPTGAASAAAALPPVPNVVAPAVVEPVLPNAADATRSARATPPSLSASFSLAATGRASMPSPALSTSPLSYFVQAGAYSRTEDAEQQRAKLALMGVESKLTEREQGGRTVFRVRVGPFDRKEDADVAKDKLAASGIDSALVAVQK